MIKMRVDELYTYPIKSLRGVSVPSIQLTDTGFAHDRHFMLWDVGKSETLHIGLRPALCLFTTRLAPAHRPETIEVGYGLDHVFNQPSHPVDRTTLSVPLKPDVAYLKKRTITMHLSPTSAYNMGGKYNEWFSTRLGYPVELLYIGDHRRKVLGNMGQGVVSGKSLAGVLYSSLPPLATILALGFAYAERLFQGSLRSGPLMVPAVLVLTICLFLLGRHSRSLFRHKAPSITFADLAACLVISKTSYQDVNDRLPADENLDITKFRANIIVSGAAKPYEEDFWGELRFNRDVHVKLTQNCARCASLNVDYATGKPGLSEAGKVLKKLSKDRRVDPGTKWSPIFGRYGFLVRGSREAAEVVIRVGDEVEVVKRNSERTVTDYPKA